MAQQSVDARHPHIRQQTHLATDRPHRYNGFLGDWQIAGPSGDDRHFADGRRWRSGRQPKGSSESILLSLGKFARQQLGLAGVHPGSQAILAGSGEFPNDANDPFRGLSLTENDLRKTAPLPTVKIDVGVTEVGHAGSMNLRQRGIHGKPARLNLLEQIAQVRWGHRLLRIRGISLEILCRARVFFKFVAAVTDIVPTVDLGTEGVRMYAGTLLMAGLLWSTGALPEPVYFPTRALEIPLRLNATKAASIAEAVLYASTDQGQTWKQWSTVPPAQTGFGFHAPADGAYWFSVVLVDKTGRRIPADVTRLPVMQCAIVDTLKPIIKLTADRRGNDVSVRWDIQEANPDLASLRLEYHSADGLPNQWYTAVIDRPALSGQSTIFLKASAAVTVRLQMQDRAMNSAVATAEVPAAPPSASVAQTPSTPALNSLPTLGSSPPAHNPWDTPRPVEAIPVSRREPEPEPLVTPVDRTPYSSSANNYTSGPNRQWLASSDGSGTVPAPPTTSNLASGALPPIQFVKTPRVTLEYETRKVGPSGIGVVELWLTHDDGQTWTKYFEDQHPNAKSPSITVDLRDGDRIYGFTLVVRSGVNKGRLPPVQGEAPEMRVELDTTLPEAKLAPPEQDPQHRDVLTLKWLVRDRNLEPDGVSLYWSELHDGPWKPIAEGLAAAQGQYSWSPQGLPYYVYLRLTARDKAGNVTEVICDNPVAIDMTVPEARLKRVFPAIGPVAGR